MPASFIPMITGPARLKIAGNQLRCMIYKDLPSPTPFSQSQAYLGSHRLLQCMHTRHSWMTSGTGPSTVIPTVSDRHGVKLSAYQTILVEVKARSYSATLTIPEMVGVKQLSDSSHMLCSITILTFTDLTVVKHITQQHNGDSPLSPHSPYSQAVSGHTTWPPCPIPAFISLTGLACILEAEQQPSLLGDPDLTVSHILRLLRLSSR